MAMAMKEIQIETMNKESIKPSSPTPPHLKYFKLSHQDQLSPVCYIQFLLFYPANADTININKITTTDRLKASLSETLTHFYPLAGRIKDDVFIDCADDGAEFITARSNCDLSDIISSPNYKILNQFLPADLLSKESVKGRLLLVQASFFDCGGMAIGVCLSHKVADAAVLSTFIRFWAATARHDLTSSMSMMPDFIGSSIFPPVEAESTMNSIPVSKEKSCVTKRFVLDASKIAALKAKLASASVPNPTRVEAVSSLIFKCATLASNTKKLRTKRTTPSLWCFKLNLRKRFVVPLPQSYFGNCFATISSVVQDFNQIELKAVPEILRQGIREFRETLDDKLRRDRVMLELMYGKEKDDEVEVDDVYHCTSWCNFELYDADFGWGKPIWESIGDIPFKNTVLLMDTRNRDGVEALVCLSEEDMACFETNHELLQFTTVNPNVLTSSLSAV